MEERAVVTCFLRHGTEVLLLRRGDAVGNYPGRWAAISGDVERPSGADPGGGATPPVEDARREIDEAVDLLESADLVRSAEPITVEDSNLGVRWRVHPFLYDCASTDVEPNEEVAAWTWVQPPEIRERETVPGLWAAYRAVAPTLESVRADDSHGSAYVSLRALEVLRDRAADGADYGELVGLARELRTARPGMGAVRTRIDRAMSTAEASTEAILEAATDACERAVGADEATAAAAVRVVGEHVLTLSRSGTVLEALRRADPETVSVAESRPAREGVGVAEALAEEVDAEVRLLVDAAMGHVVAEGGVDTVLVGADGVLADGRVVNKVGTRLAALAADATDVECYAVCSQDKIRPETTADPESGPPEDVYDGDAAVEAVNPTFEAVEGDLFDGVVTEDGVLDGADVARVADEHAALAGWVDGGEGSL